MQSLNSIVKGALRVKAEDRPMIIFPEGTRRPVDAVPDYKFGIAKVYKETKLPIVPLALNSGLYWGRNSFWKKSGTVIFEFLPMIEAERPHQEMLKRLEDAIEPATQRLLDEGRRALGDCDKNQK